MTVTTGEHVPLEVKEHEGRRVLVLPYDWRRVDRSLDVDVLVDVLGFVRREQAALDRFAEFAGGPVYWDQGVWFEQLRNGSCQTACCFAGASVLAATRSPLHEDTHVADTMDADVASETILEVVVPRDSEGNRDWDVLDDYVGHSWVSEFVLVRQADGELLEDMVNVPGLARWVIGLPLARGGPGQVGDYSAWANSLFAGGNDLERVEHVIADMCDSIGATERVNEALAARGYEPLTTEREW